MWPFSKKVNLPGFQKDEKDNITFSLTEEEQIEVQKQFNLLKDYVIHAKVADVLQQGMTAQGLFFYAEEQIMLSEFNSKFILSLK